MTLKLWPCDHEEGELVYQGNVSQIRTLGGEGNWLPDGVTKFNPCFLCRTTPFLFLLLFIAMQSLTGKRVNCADRGCKPGADLSKRQRWSGCILERLPGTRLAPGGAETNDKEVRSLLESELWQRKEPDIARSQ